MSPLGWILAAALFSAAPSGAERAPVLVALLGPLSPASTRHLIKTIDYYGDYGSFALGEASPAAVRSLSRAGFAVEVLGSWPEASELVVAPSDEPAAAGSRVLWSAGSHRLLVVPHEVARVEPEAVHGCHAHGRAVVARRAWTPSAGFRHGSPSVNATVTAPDDRIAPLVAQIDGANIQSTVGVLSSYFTRRADSAEILLARDWLLAQLSSIPGLTVSTHSFSPTEAENVVAELTGVTHPERVVVLGAHYDSINGAGPAETAPGADDNASGTGGILEAARVLSQGTFDNTIRFVLFSAEEFGLVGADAYATDLLAEGVEPVAMLNMDMISHLEAGDAFDLDLADNNTDATLTQFCRDVTAAYVPGLPTVTGSLLGGTSDHQAFQSHGIPSAFFFEDLDSFSMVIHTDADVLGSSANDFGLAESIARAFTACAAELAQPVDLALGHGELGDTGDGGGPYPIAATAQTLTSSPVDGLEVFWRVDGGAWQSRPLLRGNAQGTWLGSIPGGFERGVVDYYVVGRDVAGHREWLPEAWDAGLRFYTFTVGDIQRLAFDDFETVDDNGWVHQQLATQDDWMHDVPAGKSGDPAAAFSGTKVWGNDLGPTGFNGAYAANVHNLLDSPVFDLTGQSDVHLRFRRWLGVEDGFFDQATILVNGTPVWTNPATPGGGTNHTIDTTWTPQSIDVSSLADGNPAVQVRFELQSDGGLQFAGWNVDDLELASIGLGTVEPLVASHRYVSAGGGGAIELSLDAGASLGGREFVVLSRIRTPRRPTAGPALGSPATALIGLGTAGLPALRGTLAPDGTAATVFASPAGLDHVAGRTLAVSFVVLPEGFESNAVELVYVP